MRPRFGAAVFVCAPSAGIAADMGIDKELQAARAVAANLGFGRVEPVVVSRSKHTSIRLDPLPIIARVRPAASGDSAYESAVREVAIASALASLGAPTVRPVSDIAPGPHAQDGCVMTLWDAVRHRPIKRGERVLAVEALRRLHQALGDLHADLPPFTSLIDTCEAILADPSQMPNLSAEDRSFLSRLYYRLREDLEDQVFTNVPLHGDAHLGNAMMTESGVVWFDLETVCSGPLEWDIVTLPRGVWSKFQGTDPQLMRRLSRLRSLCVAVWCWADYGRSPEIDEAATYHLGTLRAQFRSL